MSFKNPTFESRKESEPKAKIEIEPGLDDFIPELTQTRFVSIL